jgi:heme-degrading monooxygenase HmoA
MSYLLFRHRVEDYARWKSAFDGAIAMRKAGGEKSARVFRTDDDPNNILVFCEWDNLDNARKFAQSADLREGMQQAGVAEHPDMYFLNEG